MNEETKDRFKFHDTIISWACIIWAIVSVGLMCYFSGLDQVAFSIMTFGQLFLIMGIIAIVKKQLSGMILTITGLGCIILPAINEWGYMFNSNIESDIFPIFMSLGITFVGFAMMIAPGILEHIADKRCKIKVKAECVDFKSTNVSDGVAYAPVYMYRYNGKDYLKCTEKYKKTKIVEVGNKIEFKINEKKPEEVYIEASKPSKMLIYIFGASFFISGLGMVMTVCSVL